jgi:hypothetical protein
MEKATISSSRPHTLECHGYDPVRSRLPLLVPCSKPSVTGARACRIATSGDRLAPAAPSPTSAAFRRPAPLDLALPSATAGPPLVLVKPATVVKWHRKGFQIYWRWRSRCPGRPKTSHEICDLIRQMSLDNPLWGAPRVHGELLKLGIEVSQATVGRYLPRRPKAPSPT